MHTTSSWKRRSSKSIQKSFVKFFRYVPEFSTKNLLHHPQKKNWLHSFRNLAIMAGVICYLQFILIKCTSLGEHLLQSSIGAFLGKQHDLIDSGNHELKSCGPFPFPLLHVVWELLLTLDP
ncbi:hypothetical protein Tco_1334547 [Tanacetum coccineum]